MITPKEFVSAADRAFEPLRKEYGFGRSVDEKDREDLTVHYGDRRVRVDVILEGAWNPPEHKRAVRVMLGPQEDGEMPDLLDPRLQWKLVRYDVRDLVPLYEPSWAPPTKYRSVSSRADADEVLDAYATALRRYGRKALRGDNAELARLADARRRRIDEG